MKIFSVEQLKEADKETIKRQGISSLDLMERAGTKVFEQIDAVLGDSPVPVKIFCGTGNNGGDGLVIARLLLEKGYRVSVFIVSYSEKRSVDFVENYQRFIELNREWPTALTSDSEFPEINPGDLIVDAIFGFGLNRPLKKWVAEIIKEINRSNAFILSVDIPSGLFLKKANVPGDAVVKATLTCTFQVPKLVFFLPETAGFTGLLKILDIGLDKEFMADSQGEAILADLSEVRKLYKPRERFSHKGTFGHVLLIGGSYGKMGSISLSATAALRAGAGLASVFVPRCGYQIIQTLLPEAMVITDSCEDYISDIAFELDPSVICFGVGAGKREETKNAFEALLEKTTKPMVIDADGLNILSENPELLPMIPENSVLTPHPKELERLMGPWRNDLEKLQMARDFAGNHKLILVIKGAYTLILSPSCLFVNTTGNPGMATAGSGDVLSGVITGLISQGYPPSDAAVFGVYLHGKSGDICAEKTGAEALIASDITSELGNAFLTVTTEKN